MINVTPETDRIYAGDLRKIGIVLEKEIPDLAWVPRSSLKIKWIAEKNNEVEVTIIVSEPFQWFEGSIDISGLLTGV